MPDALKKWLLAVLVLALVVGAYALGHRRGSQESPDAFQARLPPVEFLYLDGSRIGNYLAQMEGGARGEEHRIAKETTEVNGEAGASGLKIGASSQLENSAESILTQTSASAFEVLLRDLRADPLPGVAVHQVDLSKPADLEHIKEGWLVQFTTSDLLSPGYIRPYVVVKQSATLAALFPTGSGARETRLRAEEQRKKAESFAKKVGPNPRITFAVAPPDGSMRVLLPMHYKDLTEERSLLEKGADQFTGGKLVVVGKVIRDFPPSDVPARGVACHGAPKTCDEVRKPFYTDFATQETWKTPLEGASFYLIDHVSHNCGIASGGGGDAAKKSPGGGRECYLDKLEEQTELTQPGAVILPIAVYK